MLTARPLIGFLVAVCASVAVAQESAPKSRLQQVQEEYEARRKMRENAQGDSGLAVAPLAHPDSWFAEPRELKLEDTSLVLCGQTFATLARKEVMISGRVVKKKITVSTGSVSSEKALEAFRSAIEAQGIAIVPVGAHVLVLVDAADASK
jgi:type II secretory pathway component GspD/PulD (secretin)